MKRTALAILVLLSILSAIPVRAATTNDVNFLAQKIVGPNGTILAVNSDGSINANVSGVTVTGGGSNQADGTAVTFGSTQVTMAGCVEQTTPTNNPLTNLQGGAVQCTGSRAFHVNLRNNVGVEIGTQTNPVIVQCEKSDGSGLESCGGSGGGSITGSTVGAAIPSTAVVVGASDGTNTQIPRGSTTTPGGSEFALIVRNIPSGTQPVSGTVTSNAGTGNFTVIQGTGTNLHTVVDSGTITSLTQMNGQTIAMGTGTRSAGTQRVTIATDDIVPASQSGTWNITNISGTISLPTGAATSANQTTANTSLSSIDTHTTGLVTDAHFQALALAAGSTTSGSLGHLGLCAATTGAPTYTTGQNGYLSCDLNGNLRVNIARLDFTLDSVRVFSGLGATATASPQVSCTTTSATLISSNTSRLGADISMIGSGTVYICRTATCTTGTATFIFTAQGQSYREEHYSGVYSCITASGSVAMAGSEITS